jgi:TolB-like protein
MIIPADVVTQLAQVDPVVLIGNQVPVDGRSLALLPFSVEASAENTDTTSIDRTAVAIYDRLVQQLAAIPGLYVIEPTIAAAYADTELTPAEIAAYLGVRAVVEGRIRSEGDSVTLGLRFTDAAGDGASIDRTFDATPAEFPRLGSDVTVSLLDVLSIPRTLTIDRTL